MAAPGLDWPLEISARKPPDCVKSELDMALYATESFQEVLGRLKESGGRSLREIAEATARFDPEGKGISAARISQLLANGDPPAPRALELLAGAFGQSPHVFIEYRLAQARAMLDERGPGGLEQAAWALEMVTSAGLPLSARPAQRAARRLVA